MNNMKTQKFQGGGPIDEDELFDDGPFGGSGEPGDAGQDEPQDLDDITLQNQDDPVPPAGPNPEDFELSGVEQFLTNYGVQGGIITYEDGSSARFSELPSAEQNEILSSLISNSLPTVEQKFDLDDDEINLLNVLRESDMTSEEFINSLVDYRMQTVAAQLELRNIDFNEVSDDAIFIKSLRDGDPEITDEELAEELSKARELQSYSTTVNALRNLYSAEQSARNAAIEQEEDGAFYEELEAQRHQIVQTVEGIDSIAGAVVTPDMKEYLLHDIMELNENRDPIMMEKLFSSPEAMFKANWFLNYGESYMKETDAYWRNQVSKARKEGYLQATSGMSGSPTGLPGAGARQQKSEFPGGNPAVGFGRTVSEEELFDE